MNQRQVWWLNPAWVAGSMGLLVAVAAYLIPDAAYQLYWRTPKFFDVGALWTTLACVAFFVAGATVMQWRRGVAGYASYNWAADAPWGMLHKTFWFCFWASLAGYGAWAGVAASRGANLALVSGVLHGEKGASYVMKEVYLVTVSGVTTLTQLGLVALILGLLIGKAMGWRKVLLPLITLYVLAGARALFNSERLAVIELAIPTAVLLVQLVVLESPWWTPSRGRWLQLVPVIGMAGLVGLFGASEYFRSWSTFYSGGGQSFWEFVSLRLVGYYATALNNGTLLISRLETIGGPFFTLHFLWRFPLLNTLAHAAYPNLQLDNVEVDPYMSILQREANPEFNNGGGLLLPVIDYGFVGALLFWLIAGLVCGAAYRQFQKKRPAGLLFYPLLFTGVVEMVRIMYWGEGRAVTTYFVLIPLAWAWNSALRRTYSYRRQMIQQEGI